MCGIAGLQARHGIADEAVLERMARVLAHRGPDDSGFAAVGNTGLAHTRLSLIDLSSAGHQPYIEGPHGLSYNGEIYNYKDIRRVLQQEGVRFVGASDTEVLFRALVRWGMSRTVNSLRGMFAFAFADGSSGDLYLCRDRLGIKPLYYLHTDDCLFFASEVKAIDAAQPVTPDPIQTLFSLAGTADRSLEGTPFVGVRQVGPGCYIRVRGGRPEGTVRWYDVLNDIDSDYYEELSRASFADVTGRLQELLERSVDSMLMSDVPVGAFVSGGIDSGLIASMAALRRDDLTLFTADVVGRHSEIEDARRLARHIGLPLREAAFSPEAMLSEWARATWHHESPIITHTNAIPFAIVARKARDAGVKAVLTGEGADELFLGYPSLAAARYIRALRRPVSLAERASSGVAGARERVFPRPDDLREVFLRHLSEGFAEPASHRETQDAFAFVPRRHRNEQAQTVDMLRNGLVTLLRRNDRMGMEASIESRFPFLDENVVKFGINLPVKFRLRWVRELHDRKHPFVMDKAIVRRLGEAVLPARLVSKRKLGFPMYGHKNVRVRRGAFTGGYIAELMGFSSQAEERMAANADPYFVAKLASIEVFGRLFAERSSIHDVDAWIMRNVHLEIPADRRAS